MKYRCKLDSPLGSIILENDGRSLTGLWFSGQKYFVPESPGVTEKPELPVFEKTRLWLDTYFAGKNGSLTGYAGGLDRKKRLLDLEKGVN
jgi:methylated-DNA-[protein]-cysteine S-methyltransferase